MTTNASSNCNSTSFELHHHIRLLEFTLLILIFFFGAIFNALALWVFFYKLKKWTETRVYVVNLVVADCSVICTLPFTAYLLWNKSVRNKLCQFIEAMYIINMVVSIYIALFISLDRYLAIKHPLKAKAFRSPLKAALLCGLLWVFVIISTTLQLQQRQAAFCFQKDTATPAVLTLLSLFFVFTLPLATLSFCSVEVIRTLKRRLSRNSLEEKLIHKAIYIIYTNMTVFIICFLPAYLALLTRFIMESIGVTCSTIQVMRNLSSVTRCIATSNCCLDSVCYYFVTKEFHVTKEFQETLSPSKHCITKTNQSHAQLRLPLLTPLITEGLEMLREDGAQKEYNEGGQEGDCATALRRRPVLAVAVPARRNVPSRAPRQLAATDTPVLASCLEGTALRVLSARSPTAGLQNTETRSPRQARRSYAPAQALCVLGKDSPDESPVPLQAEGKRATRLRVANDNGNYSGLSPPLCPLLCLSQTAFSESDP
ncbi:G-protein coupled receptor 35-like [Rhea pennata]|uniref:G-protein coupled receptor 35-like n=1 Tax=Rhea pennata TaxID=8795 RepID=UPI002E266EB1